MATKLYSLVVAIALLSAASSLPRPQLSNHMDDDFYRGQQEPDDELQPYNFRFNHQDSFGTMQHREENKGKDGVITGSYGYRDPKGIYRHVSYVADENGFHAVLRTNEPGVDNKNSADVAVVVQ